MSRFSDPSDSGQSIDEIPVELLEVQKVSGKNSPGRKNILFFHY